MQWCSGLSHVSIKLKFCRVSGSNPGPNHGGLFFGLFMGFLDFLLAPFNNLWYYIIVQWSKTHQKCVIVLIAWSWQNHDHCVMLKVSLLKKYTAKSFVKNKYKIKISKLFTNVFLSYITHQRMQTFEIEKCILLSWFV